MYAVIFKASMDRLDDTYHKAAATLRELALSKHHCLDFVSVTEADQEISISYWDSLDDISRWKQDAEHLSAQQTGKSRWYQSYNVEVVEIIRQYGSSQ